MSSNYAENLRALQLENARLRTQNKDMGDKVRHLQNAIRALNTLDERLDNITVETDVYELINHILKSALLAVDSEDGSLLLLDESSKELVFVEVAGKHRDELLGYRLPSDFGIVGEVVGTKVPQLVPDVRMEPQWSPRVDESIGFQTRSLMCAPVIYRNRVLGAIEVVNKQNGEPFEEDDLEILLLIARLSALAITQAESTAKG